MQGKELRCRCRRSWFSTNQWQSGPQQTVLLCIYLFLFIAWFFHFQYGNVNLATSPCICYALPVLKFVTDSVMIALPYIWSFSVDEPSYSSHVLLENECLKLFCFHVLTHLLTQSSLDKCTCRTSRDANAKPMPVFFFFWLRDHHFMKQSPANCSLVNSLSKK